MLGVVVTEVIIAAVLGTALIVLYIRAGMLHNWTGRQLIAGAAGLVIEMLGLAALGIGHPLPDLGYVIVFAITDFVVVGWLMLFWWAHRASQRS